MKKVIKIVVRPDDLTPAYNVNADYSDGTTEVLSTEYLYHDAIRAAGAQASASAVGLYVDEASTAQAVLLGEID